MVTPDGAPTERGRRSAGRLTPFVLAATAVLVGLFVLGTITTAEPEATPETSTNTTAGTVDRPSVDREDFTIADVIRGDPLKWSHTSSFDGYLLDLMEHDGHLYLFSGSQPQWLRQPDQVEVRRSADGVTWEELGSMSESGMQFFMAESTERGIVALGNDQHAGTAIWRPDDGGHWSRTPVATSESSGVFFYPHSFVANDELMMVAGSMQLDAGVLLQRVVKEVSGETVDATFLRSDVEGNRIAIRGPLDLPLLQTTIDELSLSEQEKRWLTFGWRSDDNRVWRSFDGFEWEESAIEGAQWIESLLALDDRRIVAFGYDRFGGAAWVTLDGLEWVPLNTGTSVHLVQAWGNKLVGVHNGEPHLEISGDAETWTDTGLHEVFHHQIPWSIYPLGAGEGGVALIMQGYRSTSIDSPETHPLRLSRDGVSLNLNLNTPPNPGVYWIETGNRVHQWNTHADELPRGIEVDLAGQHLVITNPSTGDKLTTFSFEELARAEQDYWNTCCPEDLSDALQAFVFTSDGEEWTIQDLSTDMGMNQSVDQILVLDDRVVATVSSSPAVNTGPGFEVWTAQIP